MAKIRILDLCSGIGGFSLGLEATGGFETVAFCEVEEFCCKVLNKHWPGVPIYNDLKELGNDPTRIVQEFDLICGGIPCQPFSVAGKQKGKEDDRHLWPYMFAIVKHKKPAWVIVENVGGFVNVALDDVCLNLESEGYATQSFIIPACGVEAPHRRDRIWIIGKNVGNTSSDGRTESKSSEKERGTIRQSEEGRLLESKGASDVANTEQLTEHNLTDSGSDTELKREGQKTGTAHGSDSGSDVPNTSSEGSQGRGREHGLSEASGQEQASGRGDDGRAENVAYTERFGQQGQRKLERPNHPEKDSAGQASELVDGSQGRTQEGYTEPGVGGMADGLSARLDGHYGFEREPSIPRVAHGIPDRVHRLKALGNAIVPQIIRNIGLAILEDEKKTNV